MRAIQRGRRIMKRPTIAASGGAAQISTNSSTAMGGISCCMARARQLANSPTAENASMQVRRSSGAARLSRRVRESGAAAERHHDAIDLKRDMGPPGTASNPRNVAAFKPGRHAANPTGSRALPTGAVLCRYRMILRRSGSHRYLQLRTASRCIWSFGPLRSLRAGAHRLSKRAISCRRISRLHGGPIRKNRIQIRLYGSIGDLVYHGTNWLFLTAS
jgi:hypothetical protein